jgi:hypothetical protein
MSRLLPCALVVGAVMGCSSRRQGPAPDSPPPGSPDPVAQGPRAPAVARSTPLPLGPRAIPDLAACRGVPGVVANDGRDDRAALQAAIDALPATGGELCLPAGEYDFTRPPRDAGGYASIDLAGRHGVVLRGAGADTVLRMVGDGLHRTWTLIHIRGGASQIAIRDLALDGAARTNTGEQVHLLQIGESRGTAVEHVWLAMPRVADTGGDCIRLLGEAGAEVEAVELRDLVGTVCERSFISVQRGVVGVTIEHTRSIEVGGQAIDFEPSGKGAVGRFTIARNTFGRGAIARGGYTVAIGGGKAIAEHVELRDNQILDGGLMMINVARSTITGNTITGNAAPRPVVVIARDVDDVTLVDNTITRSAASGRGPVVVIRHHKQEAPRNVRIAGGSIIQNADGDIVRAESVDGLELDGVALRFAGPSPDAFFALDAKGVTRGVDRVRWTGGTVDGRLRGVARVSRVKDVVNGSIDIDAVVADGPQSDVTVDKKSPPAHLNVKVLRSKNP